MKNVESLNQKKLKKKKKNASICEEGGRQDEWWWLIYLVVMTTLLYINHTCKIFRKIHFTIFGLELEISGIWG